MLTHYVQMFALVLLAAALIQLAHSYSIEPIVVQDDELGKPAGDMETAESRNLDALSFSVYETPAKRTRNRRTRPRAKETVTLAEALNSLDSLKAGEIVKILQRIAQRKGISLANKTLRYGISR